MNSTALMVAVFKILFLREADCAILKSGKARVGYSHPVGVTGQIFKDVLGLLNRFSDTDDPRVLIEFLFELLVWAVNIEFSLADSSC